MLKYKKYFLSGIKSISLLLICIFVLSCCSLNFSTKLSKPVLFHNQANSEISWNADSKASSYEIYVNDEKIASVEEKNQATIHYFDYSTYVSEGAYRFKMRSIGDGKKYKDSNYSDTITVVVGTYSGESALGAFSENKITYNETKSPKNIGYSNDSHLIIWSQVANIDHYVVGIFNNEYDGVKYFEVQDNYFNVTNFLIKNEILAIRVASVFESDEYYYMSDSVYYYNPINRGEFTSNIYVFDGGVYDYYIEDADELRMLYYYAFVYRLENYDFIVSTSFQSEFDTKYSNGNAITNMIYETMSYSTWPSIRNLASGNEKLVGLSEKGYKITCDFGFDEPVLNASETSETGYIGLTTPDRLTYDGISGYYDITDKTDRESNYDNFDSNWGFLNAPVSTSEQLFWAVANDVKPVFPNTTCRAYMIYNSAKELLNDIIKEEMTDYEKVLSIFDYIMLNTTYDVEAYTIGRVNANTKHMQYACYYLEGIFLDGNHIAVCDGYSKAFVLLCNMEGIDSARIVGDMCFYNENRQKSTGGHAWNKVKLDDKWYMIDITNTELTTNDRESETDTDYNVYEIGIHDMFLIDDRDLLIDSTLFNNFSSVYWEEGKYVEDLESQNKYSKYKSGGYYSYYTHTFFNYNDVQYDFLIESDEEYSALIDYCYENKLLKVDFMLSSEYLTNNAVTFYNNLLMDNKPTFALVSTNCSSYSDYFGNAYYGVEKIYDNSEDINKTGYIFMLEFKVNIKNNSTLNDFARMLANNNILTYDNIQIITQSTSPSTGTTTFMNTLTTYDAEKTDTQNLIDAFNDNAFIKGKYTVQLEEVKMNQSDSYTTKSASGNFEVVEANYNVYNIVLTPVVVEP